MQNTEAMLAFYRRLGFEIRETANAVSVYVGTQMINFHRPTLWQNASFTLRAPAAKPPCGDLCFVWDGTAESLKTMLDRVEREDRSRSGRSAGRPPENGFERLRARSGRESAGVHDLCVSHKAARR